MSNYGLRRNGSCGSNQQYEPFMLGSSRGYSSRTPQMATINTVSTTPQHYSAPNRTTSLNDTSASVRECMYWPSSLNRMNASQAPAQQNYAYSNQQACNAGDYLFAQAPPKVYISGPDGKGRRQQNIPCQIAPLGTDPSSLIKPLQPLTVRVQAPADLFTGDPSQPKTISISPAQLYGNGR